MVLRAVGGMECWMWLLGVVLRANGGVECRSWLLGVELVGDRLSPAASSIVGDRRRLR